MRRIPTAALLVVLVVAGCSSGDDGTASTTTSSATTTTLPPGDETADTLPERAVTEVDVCRLPRRRYLEPLVGDDTDGEAADIRIPDVDEATVPPLLLGSCAWPSQDEPTYELTYLAPSSAPDGPSHLRDVLEEGVPFGEGAQVSEVEVGGELVGLLTDADGNLRELAVTSRTPTRALLYLLVNTDVVAADPETVASLQELLAAALRRAPR